MRPVRGRPARRRWPAWRARSPAVGALAARVGALVTLVGALVALPGASAAFALDAREPAAAAPTVALVSATRAAAHPAAYRGAARRGAARRTVRHFGGLPRALRIGLQRVLRGLPAGDLRLIEQALARRPRARVARALARLEALPAVKRQAMVRALGNGLAPLTARQRRAVIDGLLGAARGRELALLDGVAGGALAQILALAHQDMDALPQQLGDPGDPNATQFIDQVFGLMQANLQALVEHALDQAPVGARALLADSDLAGLQALAGQLGGPGAVGVILLMLQSPQAQQLIQQAAYQAGFECGLGACGPTQLFIIELSGVHVMPAIIQQDLVDCADGPVCTRVELEGIVGWIQTQIPEEQSQQALINAITADFQADTESIQQGWIEAYREVG